jgi:acetyltransferase-like isoleucine patch superfamily enzyme
VDLGMRLKLKKLFLYLKPIAIFFLSFYFEKKYLTGRHYDAGFEGCIWALRAVWVRNILRLAPPMPWPVGLTCNVSNPRNIFFHPDNIDNFQSPGTYFQNFKGCIYIGHGTYIAPNVGLITANHKAHDLDQHEDALDIVIGERCWVGMNSVLLPGVVLGAGTIVAAGAVVLTSFPQGNVIVGGVPAKVLKYIEPSNGASATA